MAPQTTNWVDHSFALLVLVVSVLALSTRTFANACNLPQPAQDLLNQYPGLQVYTEVPTCDVLAFYGESMTPGITPEAAADAWMSAAWMDPNSNAFGIAVLSGAPIRGHHTYFRAAGLRRLLIGFRPGFWG